MTGWEPVETSGLPDNIDFTIVKAEFGYDAAYNNGEQILFMIHAAETDAEGQPYRSFYSLGKAGGWETLDHGRSVVSQTNPPATGFNKQSAYWKFIEAALSAGAGSVIQARGTPDNASIWEGLRFHLDRVNVDYGGEIGTRQFLLPTNFLGEAGKVEASQPAAESAVAEPVAGSNGGSGATTNILDVKLLALAKNSESHDTFIEAVMEKYPEVTNNEELFGRVLDENGIYAQARG